MRVVAIYRKRSEHARAVNEFIRMMERRYPGKKIVEYDIDSREGAAEATIYNVVQYPAFLATSNNGSVVGMWEGEPLPLIDEVASLMLDS